MLVSCSRPDRSFNEFLPRAQVVARPDTRSRDNRLRAGDPLVWIVGYWSGPLQSPAAKHW